LPKAISGIRSLGFRDRLGNRHPPAGLPFQIGSRRCVVRTPSLESIECPAAKPLVLIYPLQECAREWKGEFPVTTFRNRSEPRRNLLIVEIAQGGSSGLDGGAKNGSKVAGDLYAEHDMPEQLTGAEALIRSLEAEGVEVVFGMPGGAILKAYDPLLDSPIRHVLARHEQGAGHMASGYAHATGKVGVAVVTSGPAATNLLTALQDAYMDSVPIVAITGQVATTAIGNDAFQEAHTWGMSMPATKHNELITSADEIPDIIREAFHLASTGRKGPVLVDVPKDVLAATMTWHRPGEIRLPGYRPALKGNARQVKAAVDLIEQAEHPVLYVGGGVIAAGATEELEQFAEMTQIPMVTTLMARGAFPDSHPLNLGMPGMHGTYTATTAMQRSDLLVTLGARFDDRITGDPKHFAPEAKVIHVDIDPAEISKNRFADVPIVGDAKTVLQQLITETKRRGPQPNREVWIATVHEWQSTYPLSYEQEPDGPIQQQYVIEELLRITEGDATIVTGVGQHQMWASQFWRFEEPRRWINSGGLGTMGYAIPAAIGAKVGSPDDVVLAIDGDGCFQMTGTELITAAVENIPIL
jgi:acetolactate synthase-1/2/3 large subunit